MKTVVITGANVGIGLATAKFLADIPHWHVVLACRNELKAKATRSLFTRFCSTISSSACLDTTSAIDRSRP